MYRIYGLALGLLVNSACRATTRQPNGGSRLLVPMSGESASADLLSAAAAQRDAKWVPPREAARAAKLMQRGLTAYAHGDYAAAEETLKQALVLYPFLPRATLVLGKIYLMCGTARADPALLAAARRMFQMAHALDPELNETEALLQLLLDPPAGALDGPERL